jgi:hypothetical protein
MGTNLIQSVFLYHAYNGEIFLSSIKTTVENLTKKSEKIISIFGHRLIDSTNGNLIQGLKGTDKLSDVVKL